LTEDLDIQPRSELLLFAADLCEYLHQVVEPALERKAIVVSDRYLYSTLAYQRDGRDNLDHRWVTAVLNGISDFKFSPDIVFHLNLSLAEMRCRMSDYGTLDRIEREDDAFWGRVIDSYQHQFALLDSVYRLEPDPPSQMSDCAIAHIDAWCVEHPL
jgi:dTMP kinase